MIDINLSSKEHSMTSILLKNRTLFDNCTSLPELITTVKTVFKENNLDTTASRRLIQNVSKKKNFSSGLQTIYDSVLCGSKLAVDQR